MIPDASARSSSTCWATPSNLPSAATCSSRSDTLAQSATEVHLKISLQDTGIGIDKEEQSHLFQPFTQADASTTRKFGGTGLGLAISKQLVELMGGEIGVESRPATGSTFWFTLRLPLEKEVIAKPPSKVDLSAARVLVVDDNEINRLILKEQLASWNMRTSLAWRPRVNKPCN